MSISGKVGASLPTALGNGADVPLRAGKYGELYTTGFPHNKYAFAEEGSYFVATSAIDTPITASIAAAYSATASGFIYFRNGSSATAVTPTRIYLDYIKILVHTVPASAVEWRYVGEIDTGAATYTGTGTAIVPVNPNGDISATSVMGTSLHVGALVTTARTTGRLVAIGRTKAFIPLTMDTYILTFGNAEMAGGGIASAATAGGVSLVGNPPIIIPPGWNFVLSMYGYNNSSTAMTAEFEMGWWER